MRNKKVLFVGCGKMGYSLLSAWVDDVIARENIFVVEKEEATRSSLKAQGIAADAYFPPSFEADMAVICVKPHIVAEVLPSVSLYAKKGALVFSIAAGKNIKFIEDGLGFQGPVVRCMPNLCVEVQKGASGMFANFMVSQEQREFCTRLMQECGKNVWLESEDLIDAVTAVSGSSPAYVAYFIDCLKNEGIRQGLKGDDAYTLALQAVRGTVALLKATHETPDALISRVATPGGTTQAAMDVFKEGDKFKEVVSKAMQACASRSKEIERER